MNAKAKALIASVIVIALALSAVSGITYSWFSDTEKADVNVSTAKVDYEVDYEITNNSSIGTKLEDVTASGGDKTFNLTGLAANAALKIDTEITNNSTIKTVYKVELVPTLAPGYNFTLYDLKNIYVNGVVLDASASESTISIEPITIKDWTVAEVSTTSFTVPISITTPATYGGTPEAPIVAFDGNGDGLTVATNNSTPWNAQISKSGLSFVLKIVAVQGDYEFTVTTAKEINAALNKGLNVKLNGNINGCIVMSKDVSAVLNLNGYNISAPSPSNKAIVVGPGAELTIDGSGTVNGGQGGDNVAVSAEGGTITINGGTYTVGSDAGGNGNSVIYSISGGEVIINGGLFHTSYPYRDWYYVLNQNNSTGGSITVKGGTFVDQDPSNGDDNRGGDFVSEGYVVVPHSDGSHMNYTVVKGSVPGTQGEMNDGITASAVKDVGLILSSNTNFTLDNDIANGGAKARNVSFIGDDIQTVDVVTNAITAEGGKLNYQRGSTFTFKNLTIQAGEGNFDGVVCDELNYINCTIKGKLTLYGKATFTNCTFDNTMANQYSIWTWGGTDVKFDNCTFNTNGKAILLYGQATKEKPTNLVVEDCTFNDRNNGAAGKAAIEIGNDYNATYTLTIENTTVNGFALGKNTESNLWANKNSMDAAHLSVTIDGTKAQ